MQTRKQAQRGSVTFLSHTATWRMGQYSGVSLENPKDSVPSRLVPERELVDRRGSSPPGSVAAGWETMEVELGRWGPLLGWALSVPSPLPQTWCTSLCQGSSGLKAWCFGHREVSLLGIVVRVSRLWPHALERSARSPPCTPQGGTGALVTLTLLPGTEPAQGPSSP